MEQQQKTHKIRKIGNATSLVWFGYGCCFQTTVRCLRNGPDLMYSPGFTVQCLPSIPHHDLGTLFDCSFFSLEPVDRTTLPSAAACCDRPARAVARIASVVQLMREGEGARARADRSAAISLLTQQLAQQLTRAAARARRHSCPRFALFCLSSADLLTHAGPFAPSRALAPQTNDRQTQ